MPDFPDFFPGQRSVPAVQMQEISNSLRRLTGSLGGQGNNQLDVPGAQVQNAPPDDNWWIEITNGPGANGAGAKAAPYGWIMVDRNGTAFDDLGYAHSGTISSNPAYEQNGNRSVPIGSIVRAWVNDDNGTPCMEFDAGAAAIDPCCPVYGGVYGDDCRCNCCGGGTSGCCGYWALTWRDVLCNGATVLKLDWIFIPTNDPITGLCITTPPPPPDPSLVAFVTGWQAGYQIVPCGTPPPPDVLVFGQPQPCSSTGGAGGTTNPCYDSCFLAASTGCAQIYGIGTQAYNDCLAAASAECTAACGPGTGTQSAIINKSTFGGYYGGKTYGGGILILPSEGGTGVTDPGTSGNVLTSNGTGGWTSATPSGGNTGTGIVTPTALASDQNDYAPTSGAALYRLATDGTGTKNITGLSISQFGGQRVVIVNVSALNSIVLKVDDGASSAANRFNNGNPATDVTLTPNQTVEYIYDSTTLRWRKI